MMKKLMMMAACLLCLLLAGCQAGPKEPAAPVATDPPAATEAPAATDAPAARAYLVVTVGDALYEPIPLAEAGRYKVTRGDYINVIEVTADSVKMAESSCDNQDCVLQGVVTLENRSQRVLQNMILCLPNEVVLELYTYEELVERLPDWQEGAAE